MICFLIQSVLVDNRFIKDYLDNLAALLFYSADIINSLFLVAGRRELRSVALAEI